jgi:hypothetical protein
LGFPAPYDTVFQNCCRDRYPRLAQRHRFDPHRHEDLSHASILVGRREYMRALDALGHHLDDAEGFGQVLT